MVTVLFQTGYTHIGCENSAEKGTSLILIIIAFIIATQSDVINICAHIFYISISPESILIAHCDSRKLKGSVVVHLHVHCHRKVKVIYGSFCYLENKQTHAQYHETYPDQPKQINIYGKY